MKRSQKTIKLGENEEYTIVTISDYDIDNFTVEQSRFLFLSELFGCHLSSGLLSCGEHPFKKIEIYHDGKSWICKLTTDTYKNI